ncbi:MAG TPA: GGDEF domain-containing protein [Tepidisphaeraceae bacterium]|nr:GGDEF domain-containing protein [Tepidisphaeraceae bacterium]
MNQALIEQIKNCPSLPSLPSIAVQVLDLAQKADVDIPEIARLISKDPALSTKMLRTVNSSFYARSKAVSTISQALVILGLQSVKTLVLGFSLVSNLSKSKSNGFNHINYWRRAIYSATAARVIASKLAMVQQEEAFLCGLLKDIGMLVLDQVAGDKYGGLFDKATSHLNLSELEAAELGMSHAEVGGYLAEEWKLPAMLAAPIKYHHSVDQVSDPALKKLAELVGLAGRCADVFVDTDPAPAIVNVRQIAERTFGLTEADCDAILADVGKRTKEMAGLFEINIGTAVAYDTILKKANEALVQISLQGHMQASQLQQQNEQLQERVVTDALTRLANRARFDEFLAEKFAAATASGKPLALIMIDIDKFKSVNDKHGHPAGDAVIQAVARLVKVASRATDLAARYGGEEMAIILPDTTRQHAANVAETVRRALAAKPIKTPSAQLPITASFGVACVEPGVPIKLPAHLIKAADLALYHAKNSGRNNVKVFMPKPAAVAA